MKSKKIKKILLIISLVLICSMILPYLSACKKDDGNNNNNIGNNGNGGGDNNADNSGAGANEAVEAIYTAKEIADAIIAAYAESDIPEDTFFEYFFSGVDENSENYLDPEKAGRMINGNSAAVKELDYLEDYAFYVPIGNHFFEVDVMKIREGGESNLDAVKDMLDKRIKRKDDGDIRFYVQHEVPLIENAKIVTAGRYVILLVTTDNGKADGVINNMLKSGSNSGLENNNTNNNTESPDNINVIENNQNNQNAAEEQTQPEETKPVSMDEVVNIAPEILFDIDQFKTLVDSKNEEQTEPPEASANTNTRKTAVPSVTVKSYSHNTSFLIGGKCEVGAMVRVTGGTEEIYTGSNYGDYLVEIPFESTGTTTLKLTAELDGKQPSDEIAFIVKPQRDVSYYDDSGIYGVVIGYNYMSYFDDCLPDYLGTNLISDKEIESLKTRTEKRISDLRAKGCNAEIIYLLSPNSMRIWPEDVPKRYIEYKEDTLLRQWKKGVTEGGATVLDLTDLMMAHKYDEFKIWHKTDSHWSEYGAYLAYVELMNYIARNFPDAAPRPASDFEFFNEEVNFGDIYATIGLDISDMHETSTFVKLKFDPPHYNSDYNTGHVNIYDQNCAMRMSVRPIHARVQFSHTTESNVKGVNLPKAYFFRDSFEGPLHAFYTDRFSTAIFKSMWDYNFNVNQIVNADPDYIIYVVNERNIKNVLYD